MLRRGLPQFVAALFIAFAFFPGCYSEILEKQAQQIKEQEAEIARQRQEIDALLAAQKLGDRKRRDCNRAFREFFEKAQATTEKERAIALYRDGLALCPDDEIAHYELGKALADLGRYPEAEKELEAALTINPELTDAKKQLEAVRKNR